VNTKEGPEVARGENSVSYIFFPQALAGKNQAFIFAYSFSVYRLPSLLTPRDNSTVETPHIISEICAKIYSKEG
jgi:hypothetical protein